MEKYSEHFTVAEMTVTEKNLENKPGHVEDMNLIELCHDILEAVRELLKCPISINSGFRSPAVNRAVGGKPTSQHLDGNAADIVPLGMRVQDAYLLIRDSNIPYDQLILYPEFIHISRAKKPRRKAWIE